MTNLTLQARHTAQVRLAEWGRQSPEGLAGQDLAGLRLGDDASKALANSVRTKLDIRELLSGIEVEATSYVGRVQLNGLGVTIEPKLGADLLLRLFRYAHGFGRLDLLPPAPFDSSERLFLDVLIAQLHAEVAELMTRGLARRYEPVSRTLMQPRGRLEMESLVKSGLRVDKGLPCRYFQRQEDTIVNRVLLAGLRLAATLTSEPSLRIACLRSAEVMSASISSVRLDRYQLTMARQKLDRLVSAYRPAIDLIEMLWEGLSLADAREGLRPTVHGFLYDMNLFFQALVSRFLQGQLGRRE